MEFLSEYLIEEALIVIPVLLILGKMLKETPRIKRWTIPYIILIIGVVVTFLMLGFNVDAFIQGVLVSGAAVFGHQLVKQAKNKGGE